MTPSLEDFVTALGLVMVIEGCLYALFPAMMQRALEAPFEALRLGGLVAVAMGVLTVWLARG